MPTLTSTSTTSAPSLSDEVERPLIAFLGRAGAGKTAAAESLSLIDPGYRIVHFAATLKDAAKFIWGEDAHMNRGLLQWFGNTMREYDENVWVNNAERQLDIYRKAGRGVVLDDLRFPNEADMLSRHGAYFIRVSCREEVRVDRLQRTGKFQTMEQLSDITETAMDDFVVDYTIDSTPFDGRLEDMREAVARIYNQIRSVT